MKNKIETPKLKRLATTEKLFIESGLIATYYWSCSIDWILSQDSKLVSQLKRRVQKERVSYVTRKMQGLEVESVNLKRLVTEVALNEYKPVNMLEGLRPIYGYKKNEEVKSLVAFTLNNSVKINAGFLALLQVDSEAKVLIRDPRDAVLVIKHNEVVAMVMPIAGPKEKSKMKKQSSLSQRALLVHVNISQWTARKLDKEATDSVVKAYSTQTQAGSYTKKLLPGASELDEISVLSSQMRKYLYEQTHPWMSDGSRIISAKNHLKFSTEFRKMKTQFERAVKDFAVAYPRLQVEAQKKLGRLYRPDEYPNVQNIEDKFKCEISFLPMPDVKDFRIEVSEAEKKDFLGKMKEVEASAMRDCWSRLHDVVKRAAEKLSDPNAVFRDSLVENISEIVNLLPALNITDDADLESKRREVEAALISIKPDVLRQNKSERTKAAKKLKDIESTMGAFMGRPK